MTVVFWQLLSCSSNAQRVCEQVHERVANIGGYSTPSLWQRRPLTERFYPCAWVICFYSHTRTHQPPPSSEWKNIKSGIICVTMSRGATFFIPPFCLRDTECSKKGLWNKKSMIQIPKSSDRVEKRKHSDALFCVRSIFPERQAIFARSRRLASGDLAKGTRNISKMALLLEWELLSWFGNMTRGGADAVVRVDNPILIGSMLLNIVLNGRYQCK